LAALVAIPVTPVPPLTFSPLTPDPAGLSVKPRIASLVSL
jgi:hypothetical protein